MVEHPAGRRAKAWSTAGGPSGRHRPGVVGGLALAIIVPVAKRKGASRLLARLYYLRGLLHRHAGHRRADWAAYRRAADDFDRAIRLDPDFVQALYDRGLLRWREFSDGKGAEADLTRVIELEPGRVEAWFNRALARQVIGDVEGALADFETYLEKGTDPMWREISRRQAENLRAMHGVDMEGDR